LRVLLYCNRERKTVSFERLILLKLEEKQKDHKDPFPAREKQRRTFFVRLICWKLRNRNRKREMKLTVFCEEHKLLLEVRKDKRAESCTGNPLLLQEFKERNRDNKEKRRACYFWFAVVYKEGDGFFWGAVAAAIPTERETEREKREKSAATV
jgi:hypothetical protein